MPRLSKIGAAALAAFGWTGLSSVTASYLVVAGGGGGGGRFYAGGGGAGGYRTGTTTLNPTQSYTVTVGAGGAGGANGANGNAGADSTFSTITSTGGGYGGKDLQPGGAGGSGGGAGNAGGSGGSGNTPSTSPSQGNNGGSVSGNFAGAGGGGAGAVGGNGTSSANGADGGAGSASSISGSSVTYAGGGGGGAVNGGPGAGGSGGGGTGGSNGGGAAQNGTANRGGGGGGASGNNSSNDPGGTGGSGIVIISYVGVQQFGGGVVTISGANTIHTFTTSGTLSPLSSLTASSLVVAGGGGGGGASGGGGGGAGGYRTGSGITLDTNSIYLVTVGAGGNGGNDAIGSSGSDSIFLTTTSSGGGGGGRGQASSATAGANGGSGGGAGGEQLAGLPRSGGVGNTPSTSPSQGNNGGAATNVSSYPSAGGGGSGAVGADSSANQGGAGGAGTINSISGTSTYYAGGGGGGYNDSGGAAGAGGIGGGGSGGTNGNNGTAGTANLGGGGGGSGKLRASAGTGGNGGSGVVIISYPGSTQQMAGGTVTVVGGNVIHTFTSSGYLAPIFTANNSLRFRSSASAYLNRTPASAGNRRTWTWSGWVKRGSLSSTQQGIFAAGTSANDWTGFRFNNDNFVFYRVGPGGGTTTYLSTTQVFRDPSAWYHIVLQWDTTQATSSDRIKLYINGVQVTAFSSSSYPTLNYEDSFMNTAVAHLIGNITSVSQYFDGYMTEINFIDGQALTPNSFGTFNGLGVWQPIRYGGSYGTNGFYLPFTNTTSTTTLVADSSPNGNNWTPNNISLTSGVTYDSMNDVPTLTSATTANYAVLNPLWKGANITPTDGNLTNPLNNGSPNAALSTMPMSTGKWYAEMTNTASYGDVGLCIVAANLTAPTFTIGSTTQTGLWEVYDNGGGIYVTSDGGAFSSSLGATRFRPAGTIQFAYDASNGYFWIGRNNTWYDSSFGTTGNPSTGANPTFTISSSRAPFNIGAGSNSLTNAQYWNFGQQPFSYTPPTGFVALNTFNLPTPTIGATAATTANKYMDVTTYTGNSTAGRVITMSNMTNVGFAWVKLRSGSDDHRLANTVTGGNKHLKSNATDAESSGTNVIQAFSSNTFTVGSDNSVNVSGSTYVGWVWANDGTSGSSNTAGSITSTVSANTTAGFSVVTYTGTSANATVGHGLGVAPSMVILKSRSAVTDWRVYSAYLNGGVTPANYTLKLNATNAEAADSTIWNNTVPTSTVFSIGSNVEINNSGNLYVAYCFAQVAGYSAFGSYTGNGSSDGTFVYTGFRPRFVIVKASSTAGYNWILFDSARSPTNVASAELYPSLANAEGTDSSFDFLSNGFKLRVTSGNKNLSGTTYIYMAFAESPFKYANAR
jgi:hypothetical protein